MLHVAYEHRCLQQPASSSGGCSWISPCISCAIPSAQHLLVEKNAGLELVDIHCWTAGLDEFLSMRTSQNLDRVAGSYLLTFW